MKQLFFVFLGGGLGSILRYIVAKWCNHYIVNFPIGTFLVNIVGSLLIGFILGISSKSNLFTPNQTLLLATGFCGGLTTFSTFAYENFSFLKMSNFGAFGLYTTLSFILGLLAVFLGLYLSQLTN